MKTELMVVIVLLSCQLPYITAPFPPCSPLTFINKMVESNSLTSDLHPYYPVPPCQYQAGTLEALAKHDLENVFIQDLPRNIAYEVAWAAGTGIPRLVSAIQGQFNIRVDKNSEARSVAHQITILRHFLDKQNILYVVNVKYLFYLCLLIQLMCANNE